MFEMVVMWILDVIVGVGSLKWVNVFFVIEGFMNRCVLNNIVGGGRIYKDKGG